MQDEQNADAAVKLLPQRLNMDAGEARRAVKRIYSRPRPQITADGLKQVIDIVWDAERYASAKGSPDKYMDLSYLRDAG